ncbi:uncharacterized protein LOC132561615 isoform X2 [Ylistrum balloti]|uniref:uncharacterized protein LOC132561615 isoform X2 n=1 Tax=Ylistrum balloti TaxID=509963 RepID=UPI0029058D71|nr:uncharacterized protein LOC132561615 isoform X2 [Ylistrum balloti]
MQRIIVTTVILGSLATVGYTLSCYNCRSDRTPGCGRTLTVAEREKGNYISECDASLSPVGCKKIITNEYIQELVVRGCNYNISASKHLPLGCKEYMHSSVCRCVGDGCNGQGRLVSDTMFLLVTAMTTAVLTFC